MPRTTSRGIGGFIWLPRTGSLQWKAYINGEDVTTDLIIGEFTGALCPEVGSCKLQLINADSHYSDRYDHTQEITLYMKFDDTPVLQYIAQIDSIKNVYDQSNGFVMEIEGSNGVLYNRTITKKYSAGTSYSTILSEITVLGLPSGYSSNYIASASTTDSDINWDAKPYWDCVGDLCNLATADAYLDENKIVQFFDKESIENNDEAVVWNDTLVSTDNLGKQTITTKNKAIVYGDDGTGLPVIATVNDADSQAKYGIKELPIFDTSINTSLLAAYTGIAQIEEQKDPKMEGDVEALILPTIRPGQKIWVTNPPMKILGQYKIYAYTHRLPNQYTSLTVFKQRRTQQIFKSQINQQLASQQITNPYGMAGTFNLTFDDESQLASKDATLSVQSGIITMTSGLTATFTTINKQVNDTVTQVHLRAVGSKLIGTVFEVSLKGGDSGTFETVTLEELHTFNTAKTGKNIVLRVALNSTDTEIDSISLGYKP